MPTGRCPRSAGDVPRRGLRFSLGHPKLMNGACRHWMRPFGRLIVMDQPSQPPAHPKPNSGEAPAHFPLSRPGGCGGGQVTDSTWAPPLTAG